jgi:hypothetical protein
MHMLDWKHFRVLRRRGASDRDQRLAGRIRDQMQIEMTGG